MTGEFRLSHHHKNIFLLLETSQLLAVAHNNVTYLLHLSCLCQCSSECVVTIIFQEFLCLFLLP